MIDPLQSKLLEIRDWEFEIYFHVRQSPLYFHLFKMNILVAYCSNVARKNIWGTKYLNML